MDRQVGGASERNNDQINKMEKVESESRLVLRTRGGWR